MAITFDELEFPGTHASPQVEPPEGRAVRSTFAGLDGEVEVRLGTGGRNISIEIVIHSSSFTRAADVNAKMDDYDKGVNSHGKLKVGERVFENCTFLGFSPSSGVLPDYGKTLNSDAGSTTAYFVRGTLTFHQLGLEPS